MSSRVRPASAIAASAASIAKATMLRSDRRSIADDPTPINATLGSGTGRSSQDGDAQVAGVASHRSNARGTPDRVQSRSELGALCAPTIRVHVAPPSTIAEQRSCSASLHPGIAIEITEDFISAALFPPVTPP